MRARRTCLIVSRRDGMAVSVHLIHPTLPSHFSHAFPLPFPFHTRKTFTDLTPPIALHFHLSISVPGSKNPGAKTPGPDTTTFDETEFQYEPRLNDQRDKDLLDILPDYLTEDICFPRSNAARFYARVVDCLTKRVQDVEVVEGGDGEEEEGEKTEFEEGEGEGERTMGGED